MTDHIDSKTLGSYHVSPIGSFQITSYQTFVLRVKLGIYGMDDKGSVRFVFHGAKDYSEPQTSDPTAPGYVTARTSIGKPLEVFWFPFLSERPWFNTLEARLVAGGLRPGDEIILTLGDTSGGSPGFRLQTYCQDAFKFRALINPFSTQQFFPMAEMPVIEITSGPAAKWAATLPTLRQVNAPFQLDLKAEDIWGNPSDKAAQALHLRPSCPVQGLTEVVEYQNGQFSHSLRDLVVEDPNTLTIDMLDNAGKILCRSNPMRVVAQAPFGHFWGDLHGQSGETIGTNSAWRYFEFARDKAFLDICSHQGNDIQISDAFWDELNQITAEFDEPGRFLAIPGYEWSGNSEVGGDRNVWFRKEGEKIRRAHRALVVDAKDPDSDCHNANLLFETLLKDGDDVVVAAHCGGRYADIRVAHDGRLENSVEIQSAWGTFEWILRDAFEKNFRVGIVSNSDGHKGRPGASYPGDSFFTSKGGYTCFLMGALNRDDLFEAMRRRHHYATTGTRMYLDVSASFDADVTVFERDPRVFGPDVARQFTNSAKMGDIVEAPPNCEAVHLNFDATGSAPLERVEVMDGGKVIETIRPNPPTLGEIRTLRLVWTGAQYRGRGRNMKWKGKVSITGNQIESFDPVNFWSPEQQPKQTEADEIEFEGITAGNQQGLIIHLRDASNGHLSFSSNQINFELYTESSSTRVFGLTSGRRTIQLPA